MVQPQLARCRCRHRSQATASQPPPMQLCAAALLLLLSHISPVSAYTAGWPFSRAARAHTSAAARPIRVPLPAARPSALAATVAMSDDDDDDHGSPGGELPDARRVQQRRRRLLQQAAAGDAAAQQLLHAAAARAGGAALPALPSPRIITIAEQMEQALYLGRLTLTPAELMHGQALLGRPQDTHVFKPPPATPSAWQQGYLAICVVVKDQYTDLLEWIEYHRYIGVKKIYVYDNNSTEPLAGRISEHLRSGLVEYTYFAGRPRVRRMFRTSSQWWAYHDCIRRFRDRHRWLAFIDADEFLVVNPMGGPDGAGGSIDQLLTEYEHHPGLAVNWVIFGSSGHKQRPHGGVLINYHQCLPWEQHENNHVKVIANTEYLLTVGDDPHTVVYNDAKLVTVNEAFEEVRGALTTTPRHKRIGLYHYLTKSEGEYRQKMARGSAAGNHKGMDFFHAINDLATDECVAGVPLGLKCCPSVHTELSAVAEAAQAAVAGQHGGALGSAPIAGVPVIGPARIGPPIGPAGQGVLPTQQAMRMLNA